MFPPLLYTISKHPTNIAQGLQHSIGVRYNISTGKNLLPVEPTTLGGMKIAKHPNRTGKIHNLPNRQRQHTKLAGLQYEHLPRLQPRVHLLR